MPEDTGGGGNGGLVMRSADKAANMDKTTSTGMAPDNDPAYATHFGLGYGDWLVVILVIWFFHKPLMRWLKSLGESEHREEKSAPAAAFEFQCSHCKKWRGQFNKPQVSKIRRGQIWVESSVCDNCINKMTSDEIDS